MKIMNGLGIAVILTLIAWTSSAGVVNVKDFGARGDGAEDDTVAFRRALAVAGTGKAGGALYIPAGRYIISDTLRIEKVRGLKIFGDGASGLQPPGRPFPNDRNCSTNLIWKGKPGGTLLEMHGSGGISLRDLTLCGTGEPNRNAAGAGILLHMRHENGFGQMINTIADVGFMFADVGVRMADSPGEYTCSDMQVANTVLRGLKTGFQVVNDQGVDFTFTFLFCNDVNTVLDFQRGGNLLVNSAQMTNCDLFLNIAGGGRNAGVFLLQNVRQEATGNGGAKKRDTLLRSYPRFSTALVRFVNFNDVQWNWHNNHTPDRDKPLCDIGPGSTVVFETAIFNSPVAQLTGSAEADARLIIRNSCFSYALPEKSVKAGKNGYFKLTDNFTDKMKLLPDYCRWPSVGVDKNK